MIYVLHGDDSVTSRNYITTIAGKKQTLVLDGKAISFPDLAEQLNSQSLFGDEKVVVLEHFLSKNKKKKEILQLIIDGNLHADLIFWESTKLTPATLALVKQSDVKAFLLPQYYFQFLDAFAPGNPQKIYTLYHQLLETMTAEQIFYSLIKRVRQLLILQMGSIAESKETVSVQGWQLDKLRTQLSKWKKNSLPTMFESLQDTEIKTKSGGLPVGLSKHLDILILTQLI